jgi:hypothetical protein
MPVEHPAVELDQHIQEQAAVLGLSRVTAVQGRAMQLSVGRLAGVVVRRPWAPTTSDSFFPSTTCK